MKINLKYLLFFLIGFSCFKLSATNCKNISFTISCGIGSCFGTDGDDIIKSSPLTSKVFAGKGNDIICIVGESKAEIFGGEGNDKIYGGSGNDRIFGEAGNDIIYGGAGDDRLFGGTGDDKIFGESGNDRLCGEKGKDQLDGGGQDRDTCSKSKVVKNCPNFSDSSPKYSCP